MEIKNLIMIVDDDARNIFALALTLKAKGYKVITCQSGKEALELLFGDKQVGLVLMDMMMPEMDGYETIRLIRKNENTKDIPIVAVTAQAMAGDREKCIKAGANDYISKPIQVDILMEVVKQWV
ncbi:response regulator [Sphingobacterium faecale]|uniref:Response regulator n=1 Tax=Sphingobacterium faecale TaxID=2803775 RepID=A0ABS1R144_9SPHI|nr:response regulator [Sphingobacterium faecale]MBL1408406.1 response regulator [Sphingobacterium faecale]